MGFGLNDGQNGRSALVGVSWGLVVVLLGSLCPVDKASPGFNGSSTLLRPNIQVINQVHSPAHTDVDGQSIKADNDQYGFVKSVGSTTKLAN